MAIVKLKRFCFFLLISFHLMMGAEEPKKIALLFLTYGDLNQTELWKEYLQPHLDKFNIYIHPKTPIQDPFFSPFTISKLYETSWLHNIRAERALLKQAFRNPANYKFVLLSNSCVPLVDPETLYLTLIQDNHSYMFYSGKMWDPNRMIDLPDEHRTGNHQWFTLNRRHAKVCIKDKKILAIAEKTYIDNEFYPSCLFSVHGCLYEVINFGYHYVDFSRAAGPHPYEFKNENEYDTNVLITAKRMGYLFARKFSPDYPKESIKHLISVK